jgi:hypothetical protein
MDNLKRRENETIEEYQIRLSLGLLNKEVGYEDVEWEDIKELLQSEKHRDTLRREGYGIRIYDEYMKTKLPEMIAQEEYEKILTEQLKIKKEKVKLRDERNLINTQIRNLARQESLSDILEEKMKELNMQPRMINDEYKSRVTSNRDMVCLISDIHYGIKTTNALSPYDSDICKQKMNYLINKTIAFSLENDVDKLYLMILGDEISGLIHNTTRLEQREDVISQVIEVSELLYESIVKLANNLPFVVVGLAQGNHSRVMADKKDSLEQENFTRLIKEFLKLRLANISNVLLLENKFDESIIELNIRGYNVIGLHGQNDRLNNLSRLIEMFDKKIDYICLGHYHQSKEFENNKTDVIVNGCFSGDDYSKRLRLYNKPIQKLLLFDDTGKIATYNINLDFYNK